MPHFWTIVTSGLIALAVIAVIVRYCREREYFERYNWKKKELARVRAEMNAARSKQA